MTSKRSAMDDAAILIVAIRHELEMGTKHYNKEGEELRDVESILACLSRGDAVTIQPIEERREYLSKLRGV